MEKINSKIAAEVQRFAVLLPHFNLYGGVLETLVNAMRNWRDLQGVSTEGQDYPADKRNVSEVAESIGETEADNLRHCEIPYVCKRDKAARSFDVPSPS